MASNYLLTLASVNGESQQAGFTNYIELDSYSWGASLPTSVNNMGLSAGNPSMNDFTCTFQVEKASFQIIQALEKGTHLANATFVGQKAGGGGNPYVYLIITLTNCIVSNIGMGGGAQDIPPMSLSLAYDQVQYQYFTQDTSSGSVTLAGSATYSQSTATAS